MFADIDDFKQINDRYGHPAGDKLLSQVAQLLRDCLRQDDLLGRYGGEEFIIFLPDTSPFQGYKVAERIYHRLAQARMSPQAVTMSLGIAASDGKRDYLETLISEADAAMVSGKKQWQKQD